MRVSVPAAGMVSAVLLVKEVPLSRGCVRCSARRGGIYRKGPEPGGDPLTGVAHVAGSARQGAGVGGRGLLGSASAAAFLLCGCKSSLLTLSLQKVGVD